ncbi:MAG TPA: adenylate/guanylate cyclase domain-containing protein [Gaiellaceae bacterium]|nr:adenylate/guanylate cyclase domain-containing protein [Gaiellaceae bacterium]
MPACPSCGRENADDARFCSACGAQLAVPEAQREQRKVVTVLFCDLVGSTALGESTDPEALRARMRRYFEDLRTIVERHGGVVEKFVGDAVMAVFGIPVSHEDDALRAVRAASEMRAAVAEHGLEARIGVNTGEVVVGGEGDTLVTGDAVNVAARLEQAAPNGEILIGAETRLLVRDAVRVEPVEPRTLKGKSEPVGAFRLLELLTDMEALVRHLEMPLVGRTRERQRLWRDFEDVVADRTCRLFTLLGPAGIGKSRLVADLLERVGDTADVLRGRCLHYGEGITYWPLVEILLAIGVDPEDVIGTSPPETQLAFRRLLEARASERPQVVVLDDLQWAEPVFVDLVEHIADLSRDAPIFLLCIARTELLDTRPDWGGGKLNASSLLLEPLGAGECAELMDRLEGDASLDSELRERITVASAGNPLYVEEMLAMVREHGGGDVAVPPTIHALLQARIDSLDGDVRVVMERGAVEGEVFHRGAVAELAPDPVRPAVESHLATLVRKELIRSTPATFPQDEGFRFRHLLIRDAAYESLPKATRADLHERFADWLSGHELVERDEIVGYHLEQARGYRAELDPDDPRLSELAGRAHGHLAAGGLAALDRGDYGAGLALLRRGTAILAPDDTRRHALAPDIGFALWESGDIDESRSALAEALTSSDPVLRAMAVLVDDGVDALTTESTSVALRAERRSQAYQVLEGSGHDQGLGIYWWSVALESWIGCRAAETTAAGEKGLRHFARAGVRGRYALELESWSRAAYLFGPMPVPEAIARLSTSRALVAPGILGEAKLATSLARLLAMDGQLEAARELQEASHETIRQSGLATTAAGMFMHAAWIEARSGDFAAWERDARNAVEELERLGERAYYSTATADLAWCLYLQGRYDEVETLCVVIRDRSPADDLVNFIIVNALEGGVRAQAGRFEEAEALGRRAVGLADETDFVVNRAETRLLLAESLHRARRGNPEAAALATEVLSLLDAKGDRTWAARVRERLDELGIALA